MERVLYYVFESLRIRSTKIFNNIIVTFPAALSRDPEIKKLYHKIGDMFLGIAQEKPLNLMNMLGSFFK